MPDTSPTSEKSQPYTGASAKANPSPGGGQDSLSFFDNAGFSAGDSRARTSQWLGPVRDWMASAPGSGLATAELLRSFDRLLLSSKMSPACYPATGGATLPSSFQGWSNSGIAWAGGFLTLNTSEWPSAAAVCSLSDVLQPPDSVPRKYFLSPMACAGILRRAGNRGKELPEPLARALRAVAALEPTSSLGGVAADP